MFLNIFLSLLTRPFLILVVATFFFIAVAFLPQKNKTIKAAGALFLGLSILNVFGGSDLSNGLIYKYGENGSGVVLSQQETGDLYNEEPILRYEVLLKKADASTLETAFESMDFNIYPSPKGDYVYPKEGETFALKYLPQNPNLFVILADAPSEYSASVECDRLKTEMIEAKRKVEFAEGNAKYQEAYQEAEGKYQEAKCDKIPDEKIIETEKEVVE